MQRNIYLQFIEIDETFFMQIKHLIIFALAGIVILAGFNMISGSQRVVMPAEPLIKYALGDNESGNPFPFR